MTSNVAFVIGAGTNIGLSVSAQLKSKGYSVAIGSRNPDFEKAKSEGFFAVKLDIENIETIKAAFASVKAELGEPNVVIFNAAVTHLAPAKDPLQLPVADFARDVTPGIALYAAAHAALPGFRAPQHKNSPKVFIATGNALPFCKPSAIVHLMGLTAQKIAQCHLIELFSDCYKGEGIRFHFATANEIDIKKDWKSAATGTLHSEIYWDLITRETPAPWKYTFTPDGKQVADDYEVPQEWIKTIVALDPNA